MASFMIQQLFLVIEVIISLSLFLFFVVIVTELQ
jgi:hypothetical protein